MTSNRLTHQANKVPLALIIVLVSAFSLLTMGCSQNSVDSTNNQFDADKGIDNLTLADQILEEALGEPNVSFAKAATSTRMTVEVLPEIQSELVLATSSVKYTRGGSVLALDLDGETVVFRFPANTITSGTAYLLGADSLITVEGVKSTTDGVTTYEYICTPHGLEFQDAVQLTQPFNAPTGTNLGLYYYDESIRGNPWDLLEVTTVSNNYANFNLWHFSKYGISE